MLKNKRRDKCTFVDEVRDPIRTSTERWTTLDEAPPGYALGKENNPHARKTRIDIEGRDEIKRYAGMGMDNKIDRDLRSGNDGRRNIPYSGTIRYHNK